MTHNSLLHLRYHQNRFLWLIMTTAVGLFLLLLLATQPTQAAPVACSEADLNTAITNATLGETLNFTADCTITLTSQVVINQDLTITGDGFNVVIDGNNATRVFDIPAGRTVILDGLIIQNGYIAPAAGEDNENGANIRNAGNLTVRNSAILSGTVNGGDWAEGEGFGGGINLNDGSTLHVVNSTFASNIAEQGGGAIAVATGSATVTIANSTIINNNERSGADAGGLSVTVLSPDAVVKNSIFANNISLGLNLGQPDELRNSYRPVTSQGYNLSDDDLATTTKATGDQFEIDPDLGAVNGNGVAVPNNTSLAIDGGDPAGCTDHLAATIMQDLRGNDRADLRCDVGAVEFDLADGDTVIKSVAVNTTESFGPTMIQINRTAGGSDPGVITVQKVSNAPGVQNAGEMPVHWFISPAGSDTGLTIDLSLCYTAVELANAPGATAGTLEMYRWTTSGSPWVLIGADSRPTVNGNGCVLKNGVTDLSWWTIASTTPTAVTLQQFEVGRSVVGWGFITAVGLLLLVSVTLLWRRRQA